MTTTADATPEPKLHGVLGLIAGLVRNGALRAMKGAHAKLVLALLSHYPRIHPGLGCLAEETGLHPVTISKANRVLEALGLLTVERAGRHGNAYGILAPRLNNKLGKFSPQANFNLAPRLNDRPRKVSPQAKQRVQGGEKGTRERKTATRHPRPSSLSKSRPPARSVTPASRTTGRPTAKDNGTTPILPEGFRGWLVAFNAANGLTHGYRPTSAWGRRLATQYANVLAEGQFTPADLLAAIPGAARKATRFEGAKRPTWVLANLEECLQEAARPVAGHGRGGRRREQPGFIRSETPWS